MSCILSDLNTCLFPNDVPGSPVNMHTCITMQTFWDYRHSEMLLMHNYQALPFGYLSAAPIYLPPDSVQWDGSGLHANMIVAACVLILMDTSFFNIVYFFILD